MSIDQTPIEVGQIWKARTSARLVQVTKVRKSTLTYQAGPHFFVNLTYAHFRRQFAFQPPAQEGK